MRLVGCCVVVAIVWAWRGAACELCAAYSASQARGEASTGGFAGLAEQFTHFGTIQVDGEEIANAAGQRLDSSIAQVYGGYNFSERIGVQLNVPLIYRWFKRTDDLGGIDRGTEAGIGDVSLLANFSVYNDLSVDLMVDCVLFGGVKFPTGSTSRLKEELSEVEEPIGPPSAIHGHDLTLGSGSFDGLVGGFVYVQRHRVFASATAQYAARNEGNYDYQFANDLTWSGGPGYYVALKDDYTLGVQAVISGEYKGEDRFRGERVQDTAITSVYVGPQLNFTWRSSVSAFVAGDFPVSVDNSGLQIVPDYRVRAGVTWRF